MLLKWPVGVGRASVVGVKGRVLTLSSPVMRQLYEPPEPGSEVLIKPLGGGSARRGSFISDGESGWSIQLKS